MSRGPRHAQLMGQLQRALRDASSELMRLNHAVSRRVGLAAIDLEVMDLLGQRGPLSPSELANFTGVTPATMTGILDRLERDGWVRRARDVRGRIPAIATQFRGMQTRLQDVCADYSDKQLELITDFMRRVAESGVDATLELRAESSS